MKTADIFRVQNNIVLAFQSEGCDYTMHLLIENGLIRLENATTKEESIYFLGNPKVTSSEGIKPKKKKRKKKQNI